MLDELNKKFAYTDKTISITLSNKKTSNIN